MLKRTPSGSASRRSVSSRGSRSSESAQRSSSNKRRRERLEAGLLGQVGEDFGLRDGPYTIECTNEIGSSWRVNDRGDIVLRKRGTQWNLYIHELDASSSSLAVATPARVPNGTTCLVMLERVDQPGSFVACEPSEGSVWVTTDEGQLASAASKFLLRERVWSSECQDTYVISPVGHPELFLRHSNWKVRCDPAGAGAEFNGDATFRCILAPVREEPNEIEVLTKKLARLVSRRNSCKQKLVALKKQFEDAKVLVQSLKKDIAATEKELSEAKKRKLDESTSTTASTVL